MEGFGNQTLAHPLGLAVLAVLCVITLVVPRNRMILPLLILTVLIPSAQRIVIAGLDFSFLRVLVLVGCTRLLARGEMRGLQWTRLDILFAAWLLASTVVYVVREQTAAAAIFRAGTIVEGLGLYFYCRAALRSWTDLDVLARAIAIVAVPTALFFAIEWLTGRNLFSIFGGVPEFTWVREGRLRCQGSFQHPIIAGVFWATLIPFVASRWWDPRFSRGFVALGVGCMLFTVAASASSTPIIAVLFMCAISLMYAVRFSLHWVRRAAVVTAVGLHLLMNAPVWHLVSRIDVVGGSTGYHRYLLIDAAINRFHEWWLLGSHSTEHWGFMMKDATNVYIVEAVRGGLISLLLLLAVLWAAFSLVGRCVRLLRNDRERGVASFALGVALAGHALSMTAASYFGELLVAWYLNFAVIASMAAFVQHDSRRASRSEAPTQPLEATGTAASALSRDDAPLAALLKRGVSRSYR